MTMKTTEILENFRRDITDCVFLYIQHDRQLMNEYMAMDKAQRDSFNRELGAEVPKFFGLDDGEQNFSPRSTLIKSYTTHKKY